MPPAASGRSSSYLPRRVGSPAAVATAGTSKIVSSQGFQVKQTQWPRGHVRRSRTHVSSTGEHHVRDPERGRRGRRAKRQIVRDQVDSLEDLVEARSDRDLTARECQLAVLDPEALRRREKSPVTGLKPN